VKRVAQRKEASGRPPNLLSSVNQATRVTPVRMEVQKTGRKILRKRVALEERRCMLIRVLELVRKSGS
jgi:hypothetical protein